MFQKHKSNLPQDDHFSPSLFLVLILFEYLSLGLFAQSLLVSLDSVLLLLLFFNYQFY